MEPIAVFWFRRDLRLSDNAGLYNALTSNKKVLPIFIFDSNILSKLDNKEDARVSFIYKTLKELKTELRNYGSDLRVYHGKPQEAFAKLTQQYAITHVYCNHDYEPYAISRDKEINELLSEKGIKLCTYKDQVIFEKNEITKDDGLPYTIFTPYSKKWKAKFKEGIRSFPSEKHLGALFQVATVLNFPHLEDLGFKELKSQIPAKTIKTVIVKTYDTTRDFPALNGTSKLSVHFRFGTISIRQKALHAARLNKVYLNELIWRDFYMMILYHFPHVKDSAFKPKYDRIQWRNNEAEFNLWCKGKTGYPIVDAGMRELNTTGFMHNRVRMIVASFLCKHLLIDWRWGEAYFAEKLLDFDLSANNGGWQWAAGTGCDAAPYFRVFNPYLQTERFDKNLEYIKKWVPEFDTEEYPKAMVDHKFARERALATYKIGLAAE